MNIDGNLYALRQYENELAEQDARDEYIEDVKSGFVDDIISAVSCVLKNELGITVEDIVIQDILLNDNGDGFLGELAELVIKIQLDEKGSLL